VDSALLLALRIGLLVLLWLFIFFALNAMRKDTRRIAGRPATAARPVAGSGAGAGAASMKKETAHHITVVEGPLQGSHMELAGLEEFVVGRANTCDFVLGDDFASSQHARLFRRGSQWFIEDLESRNGTYVAGTRIDQPELVGVGTDIKMGRSVVRLVP